MIHSVQPLNVGNADASGLIDAVALQTLQIIQLGKLAPIAGRHVLFKLFERLPFQVGAIHQEEDGPDAAKLNQAVHAT